MAKGDRLSIAFLEDEPQDAARVLDNLESGDVAAFLNEAPARSAGPVVARMVPLRAAHAIELLEPERAAATLQQMAFEDAAGLLRLVDPDLREPILGALPGNMSRRIRNSFRYPPRTVGAWMDQGVPILFASATVDDALRLLRDISGETGAQVFVVNDDREYEGILSVPDLLRLNKDSPLGQVVDRDVSAISDRARLHAVADRSEWDQVLVLPVTGRRGVFVGGLRRASLRRALEEDRGQEPAAVIGPLGSELIVAFYVSVAGLIRLVADPRADE